MTPSETQAETGQILDGKAVSQKLLTTLQQELAASQNDGKPLPRLAVILVGDDSASQVYVGRKAKTAHKIGMLSDVLTLPGNIDKDSLIGEIRQLNEDPKVHGILVQLPLPRHLSTPEILSTISPEKDVDGLHPLNLGRMLAGEPVTCKPCTPAGILALLNAYNIPLEGRHAVVLGRSNIVGKPVGMLLLQAHATVTYCHSRTQNLAELTRQAGILIAAAGVPGLVKADDIQKGAVVVDVGINRVDGKLIGDVDFEAVRTRAGYITPVPGGVGPMTIATLMTNTLALWRTSL